MIFHYTWKLYEIEISMSVSTFLLEHSHTLSLHIVHGCFLAKTQSQKQSAHGLQGLKQLFSGFSQEMLTTSFGLFNPCPSLGFHFSILSQFSSYLYFPVSSAGFLLLLFNVTETQVSKRDFIYFASSGNLPTQSPGLAWPIPGLSSRLISAYLLDSTIWSSSGSMFISMSESGHTTEFCNPTFCYFSVRLEYVKLPNFIGTKLDSRGSTSNPAPC